jgi:hypothetical protein
VLDRALGDLEFFGDLLISHSGWDKSQNVALPGGQGRGFHRRFVTDVSGIANEVQYNDTAHK